MEVVVAAIGVAIAFVALIVSWRVARGQAAIQERLAAIEEARRADEVEARTRARVTLSYVRGGGRRDAYGREDHLVLRNEGSALASKVEVEVEEGPNIPTVIGLEDFPVDLQPGQTMARPVAVSMGDRTTFRVSVRWTDEAGRHEEPFMLSTL